MKRIMLTGFFLFTGMSSAFSQHILFQSDFENIPLVFPDSLPAGWKKLDVDMNNSTQGWAVRDTTQRMGGDTIVNRPRSHSGKKSLHISWLAGAGGNKLNDDWVWTDSLRIQSGDSLYWWMLIGSTRGIAPYLDSVQVWVCSAQSPNATILKLATLKSNDSNGYPLNDNIWKLHKFSLNAFSGQRIYIAWRYYIVVTNALWCNIDDIFIGSGPGIGIRPISSEIPLSFELEQNYPNPFNPATRIRFDIPSNVKRETSNVKLIIYDILGREVVTPVNEELKPGTYEVEFDGSNYPSGVYYCQLKITNYESGIDYPETRKMVLIK